MPMLMMVVVLMRMLVMMLHIRFLVCVHVVSTMVVNMYVKRKPSDAVTVGLFDMRVNAF